MTTSGSLPSTSSSTATTATQVPGRNEPSRVTASSSVDRAVHTPPDPDAAWHLMAGDESALPAIGASLEALTPGARAVVLVVVDGPDDELVLTTPGDLNITWLHRRSADVFATLLPDAVAGLDFAPGPVDVFVHGEAGEVRAVRKHLLSERRIDGKKASISPYWRRTMTDEEWRTIKSAWLADQEGDV